MWAARYWAPVYFAARYWSEVGADPVPFSPGWAVTATQVPFMESR